MKVLSDNGIGTLIHYPIPIHRQEGYADLGYTEVSLCEGHETIGIHIPKGVEEVNANLRQISVKTFNTVNDPDLVQLFTSQYQYTRVQDLTIGEMPATVLYVPS